MKIEINKTGTLVINGRERFCPRIGTVDNSRVCGDWCALFFEPTHNSTDKFVFLNICKGYWKCKNEEFTNNRQDTRLEKSVEKDYDDGGTNLTDQITE